MHVFNKGSQRDFKAPENWMIKKVDESKEQAGSAQLTEIQRNMDNRKIEDGIESFVDPKHKRIQDSELQRKIDDGTYKVKGN